MKRVGLIIVGGTIGNIIEWYNFLLYGYLASVISTLFFPTTNELLSLTLVFIIFALSFLMRPLGGILFGYIGDRYGRQRALLMSLTLMAVPTFLMSCLPTYASIGMASPILLCVFRLLQGLSAGGEHTGSAIYLAEHAPAGKKAFWVSAIPTSAAIGILTSSLAALIITHALPQDQLLSWGWRAGYWFGTCICVFSIILRSFLPETPEFERVRKLKKVQHFPLSRIIKQKKNLKKLLLVFFLTGSWGVIYQTLYVWMPTYLSHIQHYNNNMGLTINSIFLFLFASLILLFGYLANHIDHKKQLFLASIILFFSAYPLFLFLASGILWKVCIAMLVFTIAFALFIPAAFIIMIQTFSTEIRYTALSFSFNMGLAIFGGTCPLIMTWLIHMTGSLVSPAFYLMVAAGLVLSLYPLNFNMRGLISIFQRS